MIKGVLDSPAFSPGWAYNLNAVTDIKATPDFLNLQDKGCSTESKEECSTKYYINRVTQACGCLPFSLRTDENSKV